MHGVAALVMILFAGQVSADRVAALRLAAESGDVDAQWQLYHELESRKADDPDLDDEAARWLLNAAEQGHPRAEYEWASHEHAICANRVPREHCPVAIAWLWKAVGHGVRDAAFMLAMLYTDGRVVDQDRVEAFHLRVRAAEWGSKMSAILLARMYGDGADVVARDPVESYKWYQIAMRSEDVRSPDYREIQRERDQRLAALSTVEKEEARHAPTSGCRISLAERSKRPTTVTGDTTTPRGFRAPSGTRGRQ